MRFLQKIIYYTCYLLYKMTVKISHPEVKALWYRNSFCFDYWVFLKSDIDITITFERATKKLINEVSYTHSLFRRYFPVIGELVIFSEHHKYDLLTCVNAYELKRDPILIEKYMFEKNGDHYEKIIFLHKFIQSNWSKTNMDADRKDKISFVKDQLQLGSPGKFIELIDDLSTLIGVEATLFKTEYMKELDNRVENIIYLKNEIPNIIYSLFYNNLCYLRPEPALTIVEKKIIEKNLQWELWGAFSFQTVIPANELKLHFERLSNQLDLLTSPEFSREFHEHALRLELI